jgi:hypothetical protein
MEREVLVTNAQPPAGECEMNMCKGKIRVIRKYRRYLARELRYQLWDRVPYNGGSFVVHAPDLIEACRDFDWREGRGPFYEEPQD